MRRAEASRPETAEPQPSVVTLHLLLTVGRLIGLSVIPPYHSLRLLPYLVPYLLALGPHWHLERDGREGDRPPVEPDPPEPDPP